MKIHPLLKLVCFTWLMVMASVVNAGEIAVIINEGNPYSELDKFDVKEYYLKKSKFWHTEGFRKKVKSAKYNVSDEVQRAFYREVLAMSDYDVRRYWAEAKYRFHRTPPEEFGDSQSVIDYVRANVGGIGFVEKSELAQVEGIKTIMTINY